MPRSMSARSSAGMIFARGQHARVGERALDVELGQALVEVDRRVEALGEGVERLGEAARPCLAGSRRRLVVLLHGSGGDGQMVTRGEYKSDG